MPETKTKKSKGRARPKGYKPPRNLKPQKRVALPDVKTAAGMVGRTKLVDDTKSAAKPVPAVTPRKD